MKALINRFFPPRINRERVLSAIEAAEATTSAQIRVVLVHHPVTDAITEAVREFQNLGMQNTPHRNGVLILLAPKSRKFAVIGDSGVNSLCGGTFWQDTVREIQTNFRARNFTLGLVEGIARIGALLAKHFPVEPGGGNALPDEIVERP
jgi:uncharacterized membrane protein